MNLIKHLERQIKWSKETFGPGNRTGGVLDHIRKELTEIEEHPFDLTEWIDVIILGFDGAWRSLPETMNITMKAKVISACLDMKQGKNEEREWPDWRNLPEDKAIEHIKEIK